MKGVFWGLYGLPATFRADFNAINSTRLQGFNSGRSSITTWEPLVLDIFHFRGLVVVFDSLDPVQSKMTGHLFGHICFLDPRKRKGFVEAGICKRFLWRFGGSGLLLCCFLISISLTVSGLYLTLNLYILIIFKRKWKNITQTLENTENTELGESSHWYSEIYLVVWDKVNRGVWHKDLLGCQTVSQEKWWYPYYWQYLEFD